MSTRKAARALTFYQPDVARIRTSSHHEAFQGLCPKRQGASGARRERNEKTTAMKLLEGNEIVKDVGAAKEMIIDPAHYPTYLRKIVREHTVVKGTNYMMPVYTGETDGDVPSAPTTRRRRPPRL